MGLPFGFTYILYKKKIWYIILNQIHFIGEVNQNVKYYNFFLEYCPYQGNTKLQEWFWRLGQNCLLI